MAGLPDETLRYTSVSGGALSVEIVLRNSVAFLQKTIYSRDGGWKLSSGL